MNDVIRFKFGYGTVKQGGVSDDEWQIDGASVDRLDIEMIEEPVPGSIQNSVAKYFEKQWNKRELRRDSSLRG